MGTSGDRKGYKIFSINTTIRNPKRNIDFLKSFNDFNNLVFSNSIKLEYMDRIIRNSIYVFKNISESIKIKIENNLSLTDSEVEYLLKNNPQKTGFTGRIITQLRALKDQGFLIFSGNIKEPKISISSLGTQLLKNIEPSTDVYSRAMIGLHACNPSRKSILNQSRPFLNFIFVLNELREFYSKDFNSKAGITEYEFGYFVLSMKDCDYKQAARNIINYRIKFGFKENKEYLENFIYSMNILKLKHKSIVKDYPDEVFRKFEMTGLVKSYRGSKNRYYDFSNYNSSKIESLLVHYKNYKFENFSTQNDYYDYLSSVILPWKEENVKFKIIEDKKVKISSISDKNLDGLDEYELDQIYIREVLKKNSTSVDQERIFKELEILLGFEKTNTIYPELPDPLRLEYVLTILIGLKFGFDNLISNIVYNDDGQPLSFAPAGQPDILFNNGSIAIQFEPTMIRNRQQQLNSETTNIARRLNKLNSTENILYSAIMIAPTIHVDVVRYFRFESIESNVVLVPISIKKIIEAFKVSDNINDFYKYLKDSHDMLLKMDPEVYADYSNK